MSLNVHVAQANHAECTDGATSFAVTTAGIRATVQSAVSFFSQVSLLNLRYGCLNS